MSSIEQTRADAIEAQELVDHLEPEHFEDLTLVVEQAAVVSRYAVNLAALRKVMLEEVGAQILPYPDDPYFR